MLTLAIDCRMTGSGGIGSYISELLPYLLQKATCVLICTHEQYNQKQISAFASSELLKNAEFCCCDIAPFSLKELTAFPRDVLSRINACDAYYTPYCNIPAGIRVPIFSTIHDVVFFDVPELTSPAGRLVRRFFYQRAIHRSLSLFTVSNFSRERILHHLHCKKPIALTYNAAPAYLTEPFENGKPEKQDAILFVGNIKKHKGLSTLLTAWQKARTLGLTAKLIIVGNADNFRTGDKETVQRLGEAQKNADRSLVFTGKISNQELKQLYASAKLLVQPSLYEGFGMPPLEAMTVGTPVILSDIPVFKEIYAAYPVTYFKAGDARSLTEALLSHDAKPVDVQTIDTGFSYEKSAETIFATITKALQKRNL